ncbi:MAG: Ig-like domain-containing protein, partial [Candidatus Thorarchaeota archaeon SMTZ1-45]
MKRRDYRFILCIVAVVIFLALIIPIGPFRDSITFEDMNQVGSEAGVEQFSFSETTRNILGGKETAFYGMADNESVRNLVGYADYLVVSHALWSSGETIRDNVRYLSDHGVKIILVCGWFDIWPFPSAGIDNWDKMHYENVVYGMNATESVKYRIRQCMDTIGSEYIWGISIGEEEPGDSSYPWPFVAWYMNLFYDWIHEEYPGVKAVQWPSPHTYATNPSYELKADAIIYDNYNQVYDDIAGIGAEIKESFPDIPLIYIISATEHIAAWFTCHPATYTKLAVNAIAPYADVIGFWVTESDPPNYEGWQSNHPGYQLALRLCNEIHLMDWNTIHGTTEWFECDFGNDTVTELLDNWYTSYWYTETPDPSLLVGLTSDKTVGSNAINLTCISAGTHSYWWQKLGHDYGFADYLPGVPYSPINMTDASRITFWVKGIGWDNHPEAEVTMYIEKSNHPIGYPGNLTLPDFTSLLSDGAWHQVQVSLPLDASAYNDWDGYATQLHIIVDYLTDVGGDTTTILFDGFVVESFDTGKAKGLATTNDYVWVENGTLLVGGDAFFESNFTQTDNWFYRYSGTGNIEMCINGTWTTPPDQGVPYYWNVSGYRLYNGSYDWIEFHCIPPFVEIVNPDEGDKLSGIVEVQVNATDDAGIDKVNFYVDGVLEHTDNTFPYSWAWDTKIFTDGTHELNVTALSFDLNLNFHYIVATVDNTNPVVTMTNPSNGSIVWDSVSLAASASDISGIEQVEFYIEGVHHFTDFSSPYEYLWNTAMGLDGLKNLTCQAKDRAGNTATDTILITVDNSGPLLAIHSLSVWGDSGLVAVNTSDPAGIERVEFYLEGILQSVDNTYPYEWSWSGAGLPDGNYTVIVLSYDSLNHSSSASSGFEIDNTLPTLSVTWTPSGIHLKGVVTIGATAVDANGVTHVEFHVDGVLQYVDYTTSYEWDWDTSFLSDGSHLLTVLAVDTKGNAKQLEFELQIDNTGPTIFINSPANQTLIPGPSPVIVVASVQDATDVDTVLLSYCTGSFWTNISMNPSGSYFQGSTPSFQPGVTVLIRVFSNDTLGNSAWSLFYSYEIVDTTAPSVNIEIIPDQSVASGTVQVSATVLDESPISLVILYVDGTPIASLFTAPYIFDWDTSAYSDGSHTLRVWANDTWNNSNYAGLSFETDNSAPVISVTAPVNGTVFDAPSRVNVEASVGDSHTLSHVLISYTTGGSWLTEPMVLYGSKYVWNSSLLSSSTTIRFMVFANDTVGNWRSSDLYECSAMDSSGPIISEPSLLPKAPTSFDPVTVSVSVSDHSGVDTSILSYCVDLGPWNNITMALDSVYWTNILPMPTGSVINYRVYANDTLGHWTTSPIYGYTVVPFDILPPDVVDSSW